MSSPSAAKPSPPPVLPILYVKTGCAACARVSEFFDEHGISHRKVDLADNPSAHREMADKAGGAKAPVLDWDGRILADFTIEELVAFLRSRNIKLEDS